MCATHTHTHKQFNSDPTIGVLLLTTHVGGLGLNLTGADTVRGGRGRREGGREGDSMIVCTGVYSLARYAVCLGCVKHTERMINSPKKSLKPAHRRTHKHT